MCSIRLSVTDPPADYRDLLPQKAQYLQAFCFKHKGKNSAGSPETSKSNEIALKLPLQTNLLLLPHCFGLEWTSVALRYNCIQTDVSWTSRFGHMDKDG